MAALRKLMWFSTLYLGSVAAFALVSFLIRSLMQLAQRLASG